LGKKIQAGYNVSGGGYNRVTKEGENPEMFDDVINQDAIDKLTLTQLDELILMLEKAGY
jgi:hypothetical protein